MSTADHAEGFTELLDTSGVDLTLGEASLRALVERDGNPAKPFDLDPGDCQTVSVSILKAALPEGVFPTIGNYFADEDGGRYRIKARRPNLGKPVLKYICEYSGAGEE